MMAVDTYYANAYKEVLTIIGFLKKEDYKKISSEYVKFLEENCNYEYKFEYDISKSFKEQNLLDETKYILFGMFEKFGATENQKQKIKAFKLNRNNILEMQKKEQYPVDNLFKSRKQNLKTDLDNNQEDVKYMIEYKKMSGVQKIFDKILKIIEKCKIKLMK